MAHTEKLATKKSSTSSGAFVAGNLCIMVSTIFWGLNVPVTKALIPDWMSADGIIVTRLVGGALLFWITSIFVKCEPIRKEDWVKIFLGGFLGLFFFIYLFVVSLRYGSAIDISIIMTLPPMFVILIGVVFNKARPSLLEYCGVAVSFIGAVIVIAGGAKSSGGASNYMLGDLLAIASTFCYALYLTLLQKPSRTYSALSLVRWVFLFSAFPALFLMPGLQNMPILHSAELIPWAEIIFILFCPTFIAYFLVQPAIKDIGSELVSIYQYLVPVVAAIAAVLMGLEKLRWIQAVAMLVIVGGMILTNIGKKHRLPGK